MSIKRNKLLTITFYIISIIIFLIFSLITYSFLVKLHYYYLFATIPMLFMFVSLALTNIIKLILTTISMVFGQNDNNEIQDFIDIQIDNINRLCKYVLIGIFLTLLFSLMLLEIVYCTIKEEYTFIAISIIVWVLLFYLIFKVIVKIIKKEIRL